SGIYWVSYQIETPCIRDFHTDTFKIFFDASRRSVYTTIADSGLCETDTTVLQASRLNGSNYRWEDGSAGKQRKVNQTGVYWVSYAIDSLCEDHVDSFVVQYPEKDYALTFH